MPRSIVKVSPATALRRKKSNRKMIALVALVILCMAGLSLLSHIPGLAISDVVLDGATNVEIKDVERIADDTLAGSYFYLFSKRNVLIYPRQKLEHALASQIKRIETLSLSIKNKRELHVAVTERGGKFLWCGDTVPDVVSTFDSCYFVDDAGYIFSQAPYFSDNIYFKFYGLRVENTPTIPGTHVIDQKIFANLTAFQETVKKFGITPRGIYLDPSGDYALILERRDPNQVTAPKVLFSKDADLVKIANTLGSALSGDPLQDMIKKNYTNLLYLDLRFNNKVFYKFRE